MSATSDAVRRFVMIVVVCVFAAVVLGQNFTESSTKASFENYDALSWAINLNEYIGSIYRNFYERSTYLPIRSLTDYLWTARLEGVRYANQFNYPSAIATVVVTADGKLKNITPDWSALPVGVVSGGFSMVQVARGGTTMTWQSGSKFNVNWVNKPLVIANTDYTISYCASTTSCTITPGLTSSSACNFAPYCSAFVNHYDSVYITGAGTAEAMTVLGIGSGECPGGTVLTICGIPAQNHSGTATIQSASNGWQEAENDCPTSGCEIRFPAGAFAAHDTFIFTRPTLFRGAGSGAPGISLSPTQITWDAGVPGIWCRGNKGQGSEISDVVLNSSSSELGINDAIWNQCYAMRIEHVWMTGFGRDGVNTDTTEYAANADGSIYQQNNVTFVHRHGFSFDGHDSGGITTSTNNTQDVGGFGFYEKGGFHNVHINDETAVSGYDFAGGQNCSTGASDTTHGAYYEASSSNTWINPYAESGCNSIVIFDSGAVYNYWWQGVYGQVAHIYGSAVDSGANFVVNANSPRQLSIGNGAYSLGVNSGNLKYTNSPAIFSLKDTRSGGHEFYLSSGEFGAGIFSLYDVTAGLPEITYTGSGTPLWEFKQNVRLDSEKTFTFGGITGSTQALQVNSKGVVSGIAVTGSGSAVLATSPTITNLKVNTGVSNNGSGLQHTRVDTGPIRARAVIGIVVTWNSEFRDANYTSTCLLEDASATMTLQQLTSKTAASIAVNIKNNDENGSHTGKLDCVAMHD